VENKKVSFKIMFPLYLIFFSLLLFSTRDYSQVQSSPINISNINRILGILLAFVYVFLFFLKNLKFRKPSILFVLYFSYILISFISIVLFSNNIFYSLWKLFEIFTVFLVGIYFWYLSLFYQEIAYYLYKAIIGFFKFLLITIILSVILFPNNSLELASSIGKALIPYRVSGYIIIINALSVGTIAAIVFYDSLLNLVNNIRFKDVFWLSISLILIIFSQSRTSLFGILLAIIIFFLLSKKVNIINKIFFILFFFSSIIFFYDDILQFLIRGSNEKTITSLSGRTYWWEFIWLKITSDDILHKIFGYGYASGVRELAMIPSSGLMQTFDSTFFTSLASSGFLGTIIIIIMFILIIKKSYKKFIQEIDLFYIKIFGISFILFVKAFTTDTINVLTFYTVLFMVFCIILSIEEKKYVS